jgi:hypothetical protein
MLEVLTAVLMKIQVAWDVKPCSLMFTKFLKDRSAFKVKGGGLGLLDPDVTENLNLQSCCGSGLIT